MKKVAFALIAAMLLIFVGVAHADGPDDVAAKQGSSEIALDHFCVGTTEGSAFFDEMQGRSIQDCQGNIVSQAMTATLKRCDLWAGFFCVSSSEVRVVGTGAYNSSGRWMQPRSGNYWSGELEQGNWYRFKTRHVAYGSDTFIFYSKSAWVEIVH